MHMSPSSHHLVKVEAETPISIVPRICMRQHVLVVFGRLLCLFPHYRTLVNGYSIHCHCRAVIGVPLIISFSPFLSYLSAVRSEWMHILSGL